MRVDRNQRNPDQLVVGREAYDVVHDDCVVGKQQQQLPRCAKAHGQRYYGRNKRPRRSPCHWR